MRDELPSYALLQDMLYKLKMNTDKGHWGKIPFSKLIELLKQEVAELEQAILDREQSMNVGYEAADVACFAMMIADNAGAYIERRYARTVSCGIELDRPLAEDLYGLVYDIVNDKNTENVQSRAKQILARLWE